MYYNYEYTIFSLSLPLQSNNTYFYYNKYSFYERHNPMKNKKKKNYTVRFNPTDTKIRKEIGYIYKQSSTHKHFINHERIE